MIKQTLILSVALLLAVGCGNTAEGMKKDTELSGEKAAETVQEVGNDVKETGEDLAAAATLTPKIKNAIIADTDLNDSKNVINVNSNEKYVSLDGHITSQKLKDLAGTIALKNMKDSGATQTLQNNLEIKP